VAGGLADRQCSKTSGSLPCLPVFTDSVSHTVNMLYSSSGPSDTQSYLKIFVDHNPQPVLTTFINIDDCAVSSADRLLFVTPPLLLPHPHPPFRSYVGFTVGKGQIAGPVVLENVSFAPSGSVMNFTTLIIFCVFSVLISFLQGNSETCALRPRNLVHVRAPASRCGPQGHCRSGETRRPCAKSSTCTRVLAFLGLIL
jgi:hypothetical protein